MTEIIRLTSSIDPDDHMNHLLRATLQATAAGVPLPLNSKHGRAAA
ncbi:hypothetical protein FHW79_005441 [Azospirillum sp. OGB3]|nr:hypothetical protein [Azospirillum sp. OGB3]MBB3267776.1 hypothetical protein [Azospirillum sp. OGB3]